MMALLLALTLYLQGAALQTTSQTPHIYAALVQTSDRIWKA
jgi:hypothetical protein